jgi:hypothetical protein
MNGYGNQCFIHSLIYGAKVYLPLLTNLSIMASDCCWARTIDPWNTGEGLCSECYEHCTDEVEYPDEPNEETKVINYQIQQIKDFNKILFPNLF